MKTDPYRMQEKVGQVGRHRVLRDRWHAEKHDSELVSGKERRCAHIGRAPADRHIHS